MDDEERIFDLSEVKKKISNGMYYVLTALISLAVIVVFPMLDNSNVTIQDAFPSTPTGWVLWATERVIIIAMNLMILTNFILQAKKNVANDPNYLLAREILNRNKPKNYKPKSPSQFKTKMYLQKGTTLSLSTAASLVTIGEAAINYNYLLLIAVCVSLVFALFFGYISMKTTEDYWTGEYLDYAHFIENKRKKEEEEKQQCLKSETANLEV